MANRLKVFWNTIRVLWGMLPVSARVLLILFGLAAPLAVLILSSSREVWLLLCGGLGLAGLGAGWVIYRLLFRDLR